MEIFSIIKEATKGSQIQNMILGPGIIFCGRRKTMRRCSSWIPTGMIFCATVLTLSACASAVDFTLSPEGLMALDYNYYPDLTAQVVERKRSGTGVEFSILYQGNSDDDGSLFSVCCLMGGEKRMAGADISLYDAFALQFELVSVNGLSSPDTAGPLIVGAVINHSEDGGWAYNPQVLDFDSVYHPTVATSRTPTTADTISTIGIVANIPSPWWPPPEINPWPESGALVKLLIEPVPGAVPIPEPTSAILLGIGLLAATRRRRKSAA